MKCKRIVSVILVILLMLCASCSQAAPTSSSLKSVTVEVVTPQETNSFSFETEAQTLREALEEQQLVKGTESEYGLFITEVNGVSVNDANQEWWCITKGGEALLTGVDGIQIADGDHYEITLTVGY